MQQKFIINLNFQAEVTNVLPVEIVPVQETLVLRARGSELLILPHHIRHLKGCEKPKDFSEYFRAEALVNRPARKLFEAWLRKDDSLWKRIYICVHKEMELKDQDAAEAPAPKKAEPKAKAKEEPKAAKAEAKPAKVEAKPAKAEAKPAAKVEAKAPKAEAKLAAKKKEEAKPVKAKAEEKPAKKVVAKKAVKSDDKPAAKKKTKSAPAGTAKKKKG